MDELFTLGEIELLHRALDALSTSGAMNDLLGVSLGVMLSSSKEQAEGVMNDFKSNVEQKKFEDEQLRKRITLIKAKLIQLEDKVTAQEATEYLKGE